MRVWTKVVSVWDGERYVTDEANSEWYEYSGPVHLCKDHGQDVANQQRQQELNMQQAAITRANQQQDEMKAALSGDLTGTQGYDPALLSALQTQFLNQNDTSYSSAGANLRSALLSRGAGGGNMPVGGDFIRGTLGLEAAKANSQAGGLNQIGLSNLQQAIQNKWNAANILSGQPAIQANLASSSGNAATGALDAYVKAKSVPGFFETLTGNFAQGLGGSLGKAVGGGFGKMLFPGQSSSGSGNNG